MRASARDTRLVEDLVTFTVTDVADLVYACHVIGSWITGIQGFETSGGTKGCHGAHRAGVPAAVKTGIDPVLGR
jgi:hypothetical protein